jgi:hypothetical protein
MESPHGRKLGLTHARVYPSALRQLTGSAAYTQESTRMTCSSRWSPLSAGSYLSCARGSCQEASSRIVRAWRELILPLPEISSSPEPIVETLNLPGIRLRMTQGAGGPLGRRYPHSNLRGRRIHIEPGSRPLGKSDLQSRQSRRASHVRRRRSGGLVGPFHQPRRRRRPARNATHTSDCPSSGYPRGGQAVRRCSCHPSRH